MRTLIVSDLHLGSSSRTDLLARAHVRARLLEAVSGADRVVLLGDALELRHGPPRDALAVARPFFAELGRAVAGAELVVVAGNHDHALIAPWLARRSEEEHQGALSLESFIDAGDASLLLAHLADAAAPARVRAAYPGLWIRDDVYATHGHYLDCHLTMPTLERLSVGVMCRLLARSAEEFDCVEDYESVTAPLYAWRHAVAQNARTGSILNGTATVDAWRALRGARGPRARSAASVNGARPRAPFAGARHRLRSRALVTAFPLAVAALNRAGIGPLRAEISVSELRRSGLRAMAEVSRRLGLDGSYVIFGHTHRAGPLPGDDDPQWARPGDGEGARLLNSGCWTYDSAFLTARPGESPYWPGTCVVVEDSGPPRIERLLLDRTHEQLRALV
jgi:UDP-2,3-diacylglucosamine pyrophosphatase LpxH